VAAGAPRPRRRLQPGRAGAAPEPGPRMRINRWLTFLFQAITAGLAAAFVLVFLRPDLVAQRRPVVEVRQPAAAPGAEVAAPASFAVAVDRAAPAVVNIYTAKELRGPLMPPGHPAPPRWPELPEAPLRETETSLGSGVVFSEDGYVVTSNHVIAGASEIEVLLHDGRSSGARIVGTDPDTDLAVLRIDLEGLPTVTLGHSNQVRVGDIALAIGNPFGVGQTVTQGIVSATGRKRLGLNTYEDFIQTDAAINPGNSGGALINARGELIGVNSAIYSESGGSQGIGFAIPVDLVAAVMTQLIEHGRVIRGWIGISMNNLTPDLAEAFGLEEPAGVVVTGVYPGSPAEAAGIRRGDVILAVDGRKIYDGRSLMDLIAARQPGGEVRIRGLRQGHPLELTVAIAERPAMQAP